MAIARSRHLGPLLAAISLASLWLHAACSVEVFISSSDLQEYYKDTEFSDTVEGHRVDIVKNGSSGVNDSDVLPQLFLNGSSQELPVLPQTVDEVVLTLQTCANMASYSVSVSSVSGTTLNSSYGNFSSEGTEVAIGLSCTSEAVNDTTFVNLTVSTPNDMIHVDFFLVKNCIPDDFGSGGSSIFPSSLSFVTDAILMPTSTDRGKSFSVITTTGLIITLSTLVQLTSDSQTVSSNTLTPSFYVPAQTTSLNITAQSGGYQLVTATLLATAELSLSSSPTPSSGIPWELVYIAMAPILGFLVVCIVIVIVCLACIQCSKKKNAGVPAFIDPEEIGTPVAVYPPDELDDLAYKEKKSAEIPVTLWMPLPWGPVSSLPSNVRSIIRQSNIDRRRLALTNNIMRGAYGCISHGLLTMDRTNPSSPANSGVILKMLVGLSEGGRRDDVARFLDQATLMQGLDHANILTILGLSLEDNCVPIVISPLAEYGNLHRFLELCRLDPSASPLNPFTIQFKVRFILHVVSAMKFLSDSGVVHSDLALRNCWLDTNYIVKVGDGALSMEFYPECYTTIKGAVRPVKWAAIETLQEGLITSQSNVWSFGVVMWEILTVAMPPYLDIPNRSIPSHLMMGERLTAPEDCGEQFRELMESCWIEQAEKRPNFGQIFNQMTEMNHRYNAIQNPLSVGPYLEASTEVLTHSTFGKAAAPPPANRQPIASEPLPHRRPPPSVPTVVPAHTNESVRRRPPPRPPIDAHLNVMVPMKDKNRQSEVSLSFSVLSDGTCSSSDSEGENTGSFPSTLRSKGSTKSSTTHQLDGTVLLNDSMQTLQPLASPLSHMTQSASPELEVASKTSTMDESTSTRSSVFIPSNAAQSLASAGTGDGSSFVSTGIESLSTFSTPVLHQASNTMELKTFGYSEGADIKGDSSGLRLNGLPSGSNSPQVSTTPFKSTDSGIRSGDDSSAEILPGTGEDLMPLANIKRDSVNKAASRPDSHTSRGSLGLGISDFSSDLLAGFNSFTTFK